MRNFFIVFALAVIGGAAYLLYLDFQPSQIPQSMQTPQTKENLGLVQTSRNNSKRQASGDQQWANLTLGGSVYSQDTLKTGDDSEVAIKLNGGTFIQLKSNTDLYLEKTGTAVLVTLRAGEISIDNAVATVQFTSRGAYISGEASALQIATDSSGKSQVSSIKGQTKLIDKNRKIVQLSESNSADLLDGVITGVKTGVTQPQKSIVVAHPIPAPTLAPRPKPTPIVHKAKPTPPKMDLKKSQSASPSPSPSPNPSSDKSATFIILSPKDQTEMTRDLTLETPEPIVFKFKTTKTLPGPVTLTVSHDPQFSDPIVVGDIKNSSTSVTIKKDGIYYWNLSSQSADGSSFEISPAITFNLKSAGALTIPSAISPKNSEQIESEEPKSITFKWKASKNAVDYHIVVKRTDPTTKEQFIVVDKVLSETEFTSDPLELAPYSWSVTARDVKNREKGFTHNMTFNIAAPFQMAPPKLKEPVVK